MRWNTVGSKDSSTPSRRSTSPRLAATCRRGPPLRGCTVFWNPAAMASYSNYLVLRLLQEAGLPPGVVNFVPGPATVISERLLADRHLGGIHFTGSTEVFQPLWKEVATNLP